MVLFSKTYPLKTHFQKFVFSGHQKAIECKWTAKTHKKPIKILLYAPKIKFRGWFLSYIYII